MFGVIKWEESVDQQRTENLTKWLLITTSATVIPTATATRYKLACYFFSVT